MIDETLGIRPQPSRILLGDLELYFDSPSKLLITYRTNPLWWPKRLLATLPLGMPAAWLEFEGEPDENGVLSIDTRFEICWDDRTRTVALQFNNRSIVNWFAIADAVFAGLDGEGDLGELRLADCEVSAA
jgi:hypothetical protein